ncbi:uncharacterized protein N7479_006316, partial [Penicillium vulpinum]|uniref:uncharacterized protein n=1 Tax=Penicillium vulpinum TaxID=29845 RepID=UPI002546F339
IPLVRPSPRKQLTVPVLRQRTQCIGCLRISTRDWPKQPNSTDSPLYCARQKKVYESVSTLYILDQGPLPVPDGIARNRFELLSVLEWAKEFWCNNIGRYSVLDNEEDDKGNEVYFLFPYKLVTYVSVLIREVTGSFNNLVKNYRYLYNLAGTRIPAAVYTSYDI